MVGSSQHSTNDSRNPQSLDPSHLGTQTYWDGLYARELANHTDDVQDEGTIWFDENAAEETVMRLLDVLADRGLVSKSGPQASRILDLGTGNGHMLFSLRASDEDADADASETSDMWQGEMVGVDYSQASIKLAQRIARQRVCEDRMTFTTWDILQGEPNALVKTPFDLVLDKGTFDAISLMSQSSDGPHSCELYSLRVAPLLKPGGFLVLTSCNWTKPELLSWFGTTSQETHFEYFDEATYPSFRFGGQSGQSIVTIAFRRRIQ